MALEDELREHVAALEHIIERTPDYEGDDPRAKHYRRQRNACLAAIAALTERKAPVEVEGLIEHVKDELRGQSGEEYTDAGMEDAFFRWPVIERALLSANKAGGLWYRRWFKAQVLNNELTAQVAELTTEVATLKQQLAEREDALRPFAMAADAIERRDPDFPERGAALRASFDWYMRIPDSDGVPDRLRMSVTRADLIRARALTRTDGGDQ